MPLPGAIDHHVPDVVLLEVIVVDDHDIADHGIVGIDAEGLALVPIHIGLCQAPDGIGDEPVLVLVPTSS